MTESHTLSVAADTSAPPLTCLRCGYDVRGLPADGRCPECGLAVARSLVPSDELRHAPPGWLASLSWGARILFGVYLGAMLVGRVIGTYLPRDWQWAQTAAAAALGLLFAAGVWLLTRRQPRFDTARPAWRWSLRLVSLAPLVQTLATYVAIQAPGAGQVTMKVFLVLNLLLLPLVAFPALLMLHLRRLALRVLDPRLAEHCAIVGIGGSLALAVALSPIVVPVRLPVAVEVGAAALTLLFYLWGTWLLLRFAIAFHRAHKASVAAWGGLG